MNSKRTLKIIGGAVIALILGYSFMPAAWISYEERITAHREEVNDFMKNDQDSPLSDSVKEDFQSLNFFTINPDYKVKAALEMLPDSPVLSMATSDGKTRKYTRFAYAHFELNGQQNRLTLLKPLETNTGQDLFLPFGDPTNGDESYGGGRYLDLESSGEKYITIDFNLAYNPYCVYSAEYSCPLPPAENQLAVSVRAGEKNFMEIN
ncbi:MAG: hypothetical protein DHS20C17_09640 [Cyclobacteriaceae bacterium]|nr:MAG: hypothetical protein DHS20C17_09640 [Cyclobacteriaceae bacterium]